MVSNFSFRLPQGHCSPGVLYIVPGGLVLAGPVSGKQEGDYRTCFPEAFNPNLGCGILPLSVTGPSPKGGLRVMAISLCPDCMAHFLCFSQSNIMQWSISVGFFRLQNLLLFTLSQILTSTRGKSNCNETCFVTSGSKAAQVRQLLTNSPS